MSNDPPPPYPGGPSAPPIEEKHGPPPATGTAGPSCQRGAAAERAGAGGALPAAVREFGLLVAQGMNLWACCLGAVPDGHFPVPSVLSPQSLPVCFIPLPRSPSFSCCVLFPWRGPGSLSRAITICCLLPWLLTLCFLSDGISPAMVQPQGAPIPPPEFGPPPYEPPQPGFVPPHMPTDGSGPYVPPGECGEELRAAGWCWVREGNEWGLGRRGAQCLQ